MLTLLPVQSKAATPLPGSENLHASSLNIGALLATDEVHAPAVVEPPSEEIMLRTSVEVSTAEFWFCRSASEHVEPNPEQCAAHVCPVAPNDQGALPIVALPRSSASGHRVAGGIRPLLVGNAATTATSQPHHLSSPPDDTHGYVQDTLAIHNTDIIRTGYKYNTRIAVQHVGYVRIQ